MNMNKYTELSVEALIGLLEAYEMDLNEMLDCGMGNGDDFEGRRCVDYAKRRIAAIKQELNSRGA